ncbi:MAG: SPOR domain-containing protein [Natronospirillum sp.]
MDTAIKKRLVGALVISVLLLLSLPVLFSGQGRLPEARITDIPPAPALSAAPVVATPRPADDTAGRIDDILSPDPITPPASSDNDDSNGTPQATASAQSPIPAMAFDANGELEAWSVQMGSFRQAANARALLERLRAQDYQAYTRETLLSDGSTLTQVMVGPETDLPAMQQKKEVLANEFGLSTLVVRFQP